MIDVRGKGLALSSQYREDILHPRRRMAKGILAQPSTGIDGYRLRGEEMVDEGAVTRYQSR